MGLFSSNLGHGGMPQVYVSRVPASAFETGLSYFSPFFTRRTASIYREMGECYEYIRFANA